MRITHLDVFLFAKVILTQSGKIEVEVMYVNPLKTTYYHKNETGILSCIFEHTDVCPHNILSSN
jgi:hypothetical protein